MAALGAALDDGTLRAPGDDAAALRTALRQARRKRLRWVVHVEPPEGRDASVAARYLARYARGVAIADARVLAVGDTSVTIATKTGPVTLDGPEFTTPAFPGPAGPSFSQCVERTHNASLPGPRRSVLFAMR
jgi:hypothetical protein